MKVRNRTAVINTALALVLTILDGSEVFSGAVVGDRVVLGRKDDGEAVVDDRKEDGTVVDSREDDDGAVVDGLEDNDGAVVDG
jgi:hypothetical protein